LTRSRHRRANRFALRDFLFDHLVGGHEQRLRHGQSESLGGLEVDDEPVFGRPLHRKVAGLLALEDAAARDGGWAPPVPLRTGYPYLA
jgi:hypothetical protein